jgi:hypothetical protein
MSIFNLKTAALAIVAGVGLSGCAYGPYGGLGVGVGYGNGYDRYYGNGYYGGGYPYGYAGYNSPYGYGYGSPYYGWYDGYYYPGTGYYVYDRYRNRTRWSDAQRRYWERRRGTATSTGGVAPVIEQWADFQNRNPQVRQRTIDANNQIIRDRQIRQGQPVHTVQERTERRVTRIDNTQSEPRSRGTRRRGHGQD